MELYLTQNGISEQYVDGCQYRLCSYREEQFEDEHGTWRRSVFLHPTEWVLYRLEQPSTAKELHLLAQNYGGDMPHPMNLTVVPISAQDIDDALFYGAVIGVEYIDGIVELVAVFPEDDLSADSLAEELNTPVDFYDKRHFYGFVEQTETLRNLYNDSDLTPNGVLGIWTGRGWAVYMR